MKPFIIFNKFCYEVYLTSNGFLETLPKKFKNNRKFKYISNCPDINTWQEGIDYKNKDSFQIHDNKDQIKIGFIGLIRDKEHVENIKIYLQIKISLFFKQELAII